MPPESFLKAIIGDDWASGESANDIIYHTEAYDMATEIAVADGHSEVPYDEALDTYLGILSRKAGYE